MAVGIVTTWQRILRFTDVAEEPLEFLSPIGGYEEMPLVSIGEAVEKLVHLLPAVQKINLPATRPKTYLSSASMKHRNLELENIIDDNKANSNLYLSDKKLTDTDMEIVASYALKNNTVLTNLCLDSNQIGGQGIQHLAKTLKILLLNNNLIEDQGVQYFSNALTHNTTLSELTLCGNKIGNKEGEQLLTELEKKNTNLKITWKYNIRL